MKAFDGYPSLADYLVYSTRIGLADKVSLREFGALRAHSIFIHLMPAVGGMPEILSTFWTRL